MKKLLIPLLVISTSVALCQDAKKPDADRCELIPLPDDQVSFQVDGVEKTRWHFGNKYPRPFFYPFNGPSGTSLTRMGHPGAQNHDHHRSVWFAHAKIAGTDFWSDNTKARIKQKMWLAYEDSSTEAIMASLSAWYDEAGIELMEQETVAALIPMENGEHALEIQITMRPPANREEVVLEKTNFGFLAVRVAKTISHHFGGGEINNSEGQAGEENIFGQPARWMDYSGPVKMGKSKDRKTVTEGITFFDHPENPRYPTHWHVRSDGWMGASFCMNDGFVIKREKPLILRYLLHAHSGEYDADKAEKAADFFSKRKGFLVQKSKRKHRQFDVLRIE